MCIRDRYMGSLAKSKPVFAISHDGPLACKKRAVPFHVQHNPLRTPTTGPLHAVPKAAKDSSPVFTVSRPKPPAVGKSEVRKVFSYRKAESPQTDKLFLNFRAKNSIVNSESAEMKMASILNELQSISQELVADYPSCKSLAIFNPSMLDYWVNLQNSVTTLHAIAQDISLIQKKNQSQK
eukprot:TRINITY_DN2361_c0_g2_i3.p1 TRINITY_DN2361_c0_g2~~TRINITY_DN2361_c0_g2_i3.p1  ORF type:complete len:180 (-),score=26.79 TRINITY_DN2361_c0_g2_i3:221-760(-)